MEDWQDKASERKDELEEWATKALGFHAANDWHQLACCCTHIATISDQFVGELRGLWTQTNDHVTEMVTEIELAGDAIGDYQLKETIEHVLQVQQRAESVCAMLPKKKVVPEATKR